MTQPSRIAAVQMVSGPDIAQNLRDADRLVAEAAAGGAQLVALPEYFPLISGNDMDKVHAREKEGAGPLQDFLRETAVRHKVWLVGGSIPLEAAVPDKVRNSCLVFDAAGRRVARYDKIHLFGFHRGTEHYNESQTIEHGDEVVAFDSPVGRVGLSICYDLRFPELYRSMGPVDLLVVPAAFTHTTGQAHWELLLRARAVENLCYVLAAAQGGTHPSGRMTWGDSMVVDPWGGVLDRLAKGPGVVTAEVDRDRIAELRASLPALEHRRL
ncbi:MAG: carbon-nitrogen hydrolase family protein [Rhodocyclaceae bacterium]|nr:carbon-nitrogen hydrolase family protein [Rhodocyclaceae bacterium]